MRRPPFTPPPQARPGGARARHPSTWRPRALGAFAACLLWACAAPKPPPGVPPESKSVTKERPGGNARDPHQAALERQLRKEWGHRTDKDRQAQFPLPDHKNWTRVRFSLVKHFTGFRYGKKNHAITAAFVVPLKDGDVPSSAACIQRFEEEARPQVSELGGQVRDERTTLEEWSEAPLLVRSATGQIDVLFKRYDVSVAWTGYPAYNGQCMIYAIVVPWRKHRSLAEDVRDHWIEEGFRRFVPLTDEAPYRR